MAEYANITDAAKRRRPAAAPYRSDPMRETVMDILNRIGAILEARQRAKITPDAGIPVLPHRGAGSSSAHVSAQKGDNVVDLTAY